MNNNLVTNHSTSSNPQYYVETIDSSTSFEILRCTNVQENFRKYIPSPSLHSGFPKINLLTVNIVTVETSFDLINNSIALYEKLLNHHKEIIYTNSGLIHDDDFYCKEKHWLTDYLANDNLNQNEDKKRAEHCFALAATYNDLYRDNKTSYQLIKHSLKLDNLSKLQLIDLYSRKVVINDQTKKQKKTIATLNKMIDCEQKEWMTSIIKMGLNNGCYHLFDPLASISQLEYLADTENNKIEDTLFKNNDHVDLCKHIWLFFLSKVKIYTDSESNLKPVSDLIKSIVTTHRDTLKINEAALSLFEKLNTFINNKWIKNIFKICCEPGGIIFWKSLSDSSLGWKLMTEDAEENATLIVLKDALAALNSPNWSINDLTDVRLLNRKFDQERALHSNDLINAFSLLSKFPFATSEAIGNIFKTSIFYPEKTEINSAIQEKIGNVSKLIDSCLDKNSKHFSPEMKHFPEWFINSIPPSFIATAAIRRTYGISLEKSATLALSYTEAFASIDPEKGAILKAVILYANGKKSIALKKLKQTGLNKPTLQFLYADIAAQLEIHSFQKQLIDDIVNNYKAAASAGIIKGHSQLADFILRVKPQSESTWANASSLFCEALKLDGDLCSNVVNPDENGTSNFQKNNYYLVMNQLCEAEAEKIASKDTVRKKKKGKAKKSAKATIKQPDETAIEQASTETTVAKRTTDSTNPNERVKLWRELLEIYQLMKGGSDTQEDLNKALEKLENLQTPKGTAPWVRAMIEQNKAWCCRQLLVHWQNRKAQTNNNFAWQQSFTDIIKNAQAYIKEGFHVLGLSNQDMNPTKLQEYYDRLQNNYAKRQIASLVSTTAHIFNHTADYQATSFQLKAKSQELYSLAHSLKEKAWLAQNVT